MSSEKTHYLIPHFNKLKKKCYEVALIAPLLADKELSLLMPYSGNYVIRDAKKFYIDLYYKQIDLAIEIDEPFHNRQKQEDVERQTVIEESEKCEFKRVKISKDFNIYKELEDLKAFILNKVEKYKKDGLFKDWEYIVHKVEDVQNEYPNAILYKVSDIEDSNYDVMRGPLLVNDNIRKNADIFISYSGSAVVNVYKINPNDWIPFQEESRGFYQNGIELPNHPLLSSGITLNWQTSNRIYGKNLMK